MRMAKIEEDDYKGTNFLRRMGFAHKKTEKEMYMEEFNKSNLANDGLVPQHIAKIAYSTVEEGKIRQI